MEQNNKATNEAAKETSTAPFNIDEVKAFLESDESGKKYLQSYTDAKVTKALNTYSSETVPKLVEKRIQELYPAETEEQKQLRAIKDELEKFKGEAEYNKLYSIALTESTKRGIPNNMVPYLIGNDEEKTGELIKLFEEDFFKAVGDKVSEQFKVGGRRVPQQGSDTNQKFSLSDVGKMSREELLKNADAIKNSLK